MKKSLLILFILTLQILIAKDTTILFLGDSLTEGYGLNKKDAYPFLLKEKIKKELNKDIKIINGGVSGSTTADAFSRLKWYIRKKPSHIFIALGANDGLRGLNLSKSQQNLEKIIEFSLKNKIEVLLAGMLLPPNYGEEYTKNFELMFKNLKNKYKLKTMEFLLLDVAGVKKLNQNDGIHPNEAGHKIIANNVYEFLKGEL